MIQRVNNQATTSSRHHHYRVSQRVEQMTRIVVEARQNQMTHGCSWTSGFSLGTMSIAFLAGVSCTVTHKDVLEHMPQFVCARLGWCEARPRTCALVFGLD